MLLYIDLSNWKHREMFDWIKSNNGDSQFYLNRGHREIVLDDDTDTVHISLTKGKFTVDGAIPIDQVSYAFDPNKRFASDITERPFLTSACYIAAGLDHSKIPSIKDVVIKQSNEMLGPMGKIFRDFFSKLAAGPGFSVQDALGPTIGEVRNNPKLLFDYEA